MVDVTDRVEDHFRLFNEAVRSRLDSVGLKCGASREAADEWLLQFPADASVMADIGRPGWNTLRIGGAIGDDELIEAVGASYTAIVSKLPKKDRPMPA
jgi:predicted DNA-binding protein (MmcQ/YjbR family)